MKYAFIGGIPTAGKSFLADKIAKEHQILHVDMDKLRESMARDPQLKKWVGFFADQDEEAYWKSVTCAKHWENVKQQSEAFWKTFLAKIDKVAARNESAVFEGENILPHLAARDLSFSGIYLLGKSFDETYKRNKEDSRWGNTESLQKKEAEMFYYCEGEKCKQEAERCGFKSFSDITEAEKELLSLLSL